MHLELAPRTGSVGNNDDMRAAAVILQFKEDAKPSTVILVVRSCFQEVKLVLERLARRKSMRKLHGLARRV
jgi:hypothetical protein